MGWGWKFGQKSGGHKRLLRQTINAVCPKCRKAVGRAGRASSK